MNNQTKIRKIHELLSRISRLSIASICCIKNHRKEKYFLSLVLNFHSRRLISTWSDMDGGELTAAKSVLCVHHCSLNLMFKTRDLWLNSLTVSMVSYSLWGSNSDSISPISFVSSSLLCCFQRYLFTLRRVSSWFVMKTDLNFHYKYFIFKQSIVLALHVYFEIVSHLMHS